MAFVASHQLSLISDADFSHRIDTVEQEVLSCRKAGFLQSFDGKELYYEYFPVENSIGTVIIVHGLSEFVEKFYELTWYFLHQGYNVFLYDQRGHGASCRLSDLPEMLHIDSFDEYAKDLDTVIRCAVIPLAGEDSPLYLFGHSMGGAVITMYASAHPDSPVKKAVLSAPLMEPYLSWWLSRWLAKFLTDCEILKAGRNDRPSATSRPFNPNPRFENSHDVSRARFEHNLKRRRSDKRYQTVCKTTGWNREALHFRDKVLSKRFIDPIRMPLLLINAEYDTVVKPKPHKIFASRCRVCRLHTIKNAKHCLFTGSDETLAEFMQQILDFYREDA